MTERNGGLMDDLISRKAAIDAIMDADVCVTWNGVISDDDAVDIAIKSTKGSVISSIVNMPSAQPEKVDTPTVDTPNCDDTISRQAAIDAILAVTGNSSVRELYEHVQEHGLSDMWSGGVNAAIDIIIALPSAQPETHDKRTETHACDLISRQAAIDAMEDVDWYHINSNGQLVHGANSKEDEPLYKAEDVYKVLNDVPSVQPERWIPCSERLPEENGQYLITVKYVHVDGYDDIYAEHGEWTDGKWDMFCFGHCGKVENIIAWMPLPEPYAERRTDERTG